MSMEAQQLDYLLDKLDLPSGHDEAMAEDRSIKDLNGNRLVVCGELAIADTGGEPVIRDRFDGRDPNDPDWR